MLIISLPVGASELGTCRIDGEQVNYRLTNDTFSYHHAGGWDERQILNRIDGGESNLITYCCSDAGPGDYTFIGSFLGGKA